MLVEKKKTNKKLTEELKAPPTQQYPCKKGTDKVQIPGEETYAL